MVELCDPSPRWATKRPAGVVRSLGGMADKGLSPIPGAESSPTAMPRSAGAASRICPWRSKTKTEASFLSIITNDKLPLLAEATTQSAIRRTSMGAGSPRKFARAGRGGPKDWDAGTDSDTCGDGDSDAGSCASA